MAKCGRPSKYTPEIAAEVCRRLACGESLRKICESEEFPAEATVRGWVIDNVEGFSAQYTRARQLQALHWAEEILEISDDGSNDTITKTDSSGQTYEVVDQEVIARSRLRVDSRKWLLSKVLPKIYGDKLEVEHNATSDFAKLLREARERSSS